jgi:hypothetical protein
MRSTAILAGVAIATLASCAALCAEPAAGQFLASAAPVSDDELADVRGGQPSPDGLSIAMTVERSMGAGGAAHPSTYSWGWGTDPLPSQAANGVVLQNVLNNQKLEVSTVINATLTELGLLRALSLQSSIQDMSTISLRH